MLRESALLGVTFCSAVCSSYSADTSKPNVIIFLVDDMGWQDTSVPYWKEATKLNRQYHTPNMEKLAAEGVKFTQAYASAVCSPSRVSLMTGMDNARHGVTNWTLSKDRSPDRPHKKVKSGDWNVNGLSPVEEIPHTVCSRTLANYMKDAGYHTIHVGKAHFGARKTPGAEPLNLGFDVNIGGTASGAPGSYYGKQNFGVGKRGGFGGVPGLDKYHGTDTYLNEALTLEAKGALDSALTKNKPFFLYFSHYAVHMPFQPDHRFLKNYQGKGLTRFAEKYASMLESMDKSLGDVLNYVRDKKIADNTVIIFMSDNGSPSCTPPNLPLRGHKVTPYEGGIRVPMLVKYPGVTKGGSVCSNPVIIQDLFTSVLDFAGAKVEKTDIDGRSILPYLKNPKSKPFDRALFWHFPNTYDVDPYSTVRKGDWKLICHYPDRKMELFNIADDIGEKNELSVKFPEKTKELAKLLSDYLVSTKAGIPVDKKTNRKISLPINW